MDQDSQKAWDIPVRWRYALRRQLINFPMVGSHPLDDSSNAVHICKRQQQGQVTVKPRFLVEILST